MWQERGEADRIPIMSAREYDLKDRFIAYAVRVIKLCDALPETKAGKHMASQLLRSGTSPAPNYAESMGAESQADFIHKLKLSLKELRETEIWLKIIIQSKLIQPANSLDSIIKETDELISIIFKCIDTAKQNKRNT